MIRCILLILASYLLPCRSTTKADADDHGSRSTIIGVGSVGRMASYRYLGYERMYLPLGKVADTPFHIQGGQIIGSRSKINLNPFSAYKEFIKRFIMTVDPLELIRHS